MDPTEILARHAAALERRRPLEPVWQACYDHVLPSPAAAPTLFDATAADGAEQLAASLLAELTPPWSRWFGLRRPGAAHRGPGRGARRWRMPPRRCRGMSTAPTSRSRCTRPSSTWWSPAPALLLVEEAPLGEASAFRFTAVPVRTAVLEEGAGWPALHHLPPGAADRGQLRAASPAPSCPPSWTARPGGPDPAPGAGSGLAGARHHPLRRDPRRSRPARCCWPRAASPKARPSPSAG